MSRNHAKLDQRRWGRLRRDILDAASWKCARCGGYGNECDHIVPLHKGGAPYDPENLQALCGGRDGCHSRKTAEENGRELTPAELAWRDFVAELANINT